MSVVFLVGMEIWLGRGSAKTVSIEPRAFTGSEFALVDLASQARAVASYLRGRSVAEKLAWLCQRGEVTDTPFPINYPYEYHGRFRSVCGISVVFRLRRDDGTLLIERVDPLEQEYFTIRWDWSGPRLE